MFREHKILTGIISGQVYINGAEYGYFKVNLAGAAGKSWSSASGL